MKVKLICAFVFMFLVCDVFAQTETAITPSNRSTANLEKNLLFFADKRFSVTQSGSVSLPLGPLFDGNFKPLYSAARNASDPYVILIENLPDQHVQAGGWIGWTTRAYAPRKFKIEIYNTYDYGGLAGYPLPNTWITVADISNYTGYSFMQAVYTSTVTKIRFTFYDAEGPDNMLGLSELFFIHPEATTAYDNLMVQYSSNGNVGIGTSTPNSKLSVNGKIRAQEIKVETANWPDYVFAKDYQLPSLQQTENYIKEKGHLPGIPSAAEVKANGIDLGEMNAKLLQKIEELTLHLIEENKRNNNQEAENQQMNRQISQLLKEVKRLQEK